jgi:hypothetical protein
MPFLWLTHCDRLPAVTIVSRTKQTVDRKRIAAKIYPVALMAKESVAFASSVECGQLFRYQWNGKLHLKGCSKNISVALRPAQGVRVRQPVIHGGCAVSRAVNAAPSTVPAKTSPRVDRQRSNKEINPLLTQSNCLIVVDRRRQMSRQRCDLPD